MVADVQTLKYGLAIGVCFWVIEKLIKLVTVLAKKKDSSAEAGFKEISRTRIFETQKDVKALKQPLWDTKNMMDDVHSVITEKSDGVPLVYNKGLEKSIDKLNGTLDKLANNLRFCQEVKKP